MITVKKILFPVDFSDRCRGAARAVRAAARHFDAEVEPLHVVESILPQGIPEDLPVRARQVMEKLIASELSDCRTAPCVATGEPAAVIAERARIGRFDLIAMPTHGYGPFRRFLLGSVTAKVLHDAVCPIWTSSNLEDWPVFEKLVLRDVVCGIDLGPQSAAVLQCASRVAAEFHAKLTIAHVTPIGGIRASSQEYQERAARSAEAALEKIQAEVGISAAVQILHGLPAHGLYEAAERLNADLMVIGRTHVAPEIARFGSNVYAIVAHSPCPVLSV
ncbi:MAG TPA: universal stress protein [Bryobacteraceae bacterium]|nr:universal stress protein [Bryobacteraceae bacterium]